MSLSHRPITEEEIQYICGFPQNEDELFFCFPQATFPLTVPQLREAIARRSDATVVELDGAVVAFANFYRWQTGGCCAIGNVIVAPAVRGRGVGRYLIERMIDLAFTRHRAAEIRISCFNRNVAGLLLYPKLGFQPYAIEQRNDKKGHRVALIHLLLTRNQFMALPCPDATRPGKTFGNETKESFSGELMQIVTATERPTSLIETLLDIWEASVAATHHFLSPDNIQSIKPAVKTALDAIPLLAYAVDADNVPLGFMGIDGKKIEMLFIGPDYRGLGLGRLFIHHAIANLGARYVDVNEENDQGAAFYEHMGFQVYNRSEHDNQGNPFPILHMKLDIPAEY
ncbi:MAG: GNAT family N-acetyltransferase [Desulfobulbus sp.]|jgi:GNAT superfamily N-acetyltransferase|uniref:GNAT family N-acetyltransferase n=1 Tax=Desulfobulbus sp. TaxID=895 RepID=UPI00284B5AF2|nr:GNAT family N-acetyltransferase [Desulfobulbus sp.]MDR2548809.1 GNAT family N-acetyltransferase [Desulfobulbus sp.]